MSTTTAPRKRVRHRWEHPKSHVYVCRRCGTGKVNRLDGGAWVATFYRPNGSAVSGPTPACEPGPRTDAYLAKYGIEREGVEVAN